MTILVITTGGTIGGLPYTGNEPVIDGKLVSTMPAAGQDFVLDALKKNFDFDESHFVAFEPRDSKLMDEDYRQRLLTLVLSRSENIALITHGTDTLLQTADFFYRELSRNPASAEIVLLVGSMMPLAAGPESDGYLNLAFSLDRLRHFDSLPPDERKKAAGVYIVLCDFEHPETESGAWRPRLYEYRSGLYEKMYVKDGRYNRLRRIG